MEAVKVVQTWTPIPGRKQEYAAFLTHELQPLLKALGLEVVSGWYTLMGGGPPILVESLAESLDHVEKALRDERFLEMLDRFMNLVTHYASRILKPATWATRYHWRIPSPQEVKYVQTWDILPGHQEAYKHFVREVQIPQMEEIGLGVTAGWHLMVGSGPQVFSEALAPSLADVARALQDERYLRLMMGLEDLVTHYESRILIRQRFFMNMLNRVHGWAIRAVTLDAFSSMVGPMDE